MAETSLPVVGASEETSVPAAPIPRAERPGLRPSTLRVSRLIAEAMFASQDGPPDEERLDFVETELADFFGNASLRSGWLFWACIASINWLAPVLIGKLPGVGRLSLEDRVRALLAFEASPLSLAFLGAKAILCLMYYEHPEARDEIGWDRRCLTEGS